jgi:hypothetical protein
MNQTRTHFVERTLQRHPVLLQMTGRASAFMRNLAIKPYLPVDRSREFATVERLASLHAVRAQIFRERGYGQQPTIIVGGFVPDATEVVEFQRDMLKEFGAIYYCNYPRHGFDRALFHAQLGDLVTDLNRRGERPVLFGISFGAGLVADFLRQAGPVLMHGVRGLVLVSPVFCTADLVRSEGNRSGGIRMLESSLRRILKARTETGEELERQVERARRCFRGLFEAGAGNRPLARRHLAIYRKIMDVLATTPAIGGYQRTLALQEFLPPRDAVPLFAGPVLTLLAEDEENMLVPGSPTLELCQDASRFTAAFPRGVCRRVRSGKAGDPVAHASLIFHHEAYNPLITGWYGKLAAPRLVAVV